MPQSTHLGWIHKSDADLLAGILAVLRYQLRLSPLKNSLQKHKQTLLGSPWPTFQQTINPA